MLNIANLKLMLMLIRIFPKALEFTSTQFLHATLNKPNYFYY